MFASKRNVAVQLFASKKRRLSNGIQFKSKGKTKNKQISTRTLNVKGKHKKERNPVFDDDKAGTKKTHQPKKKIRKILRLKNIKQKKKLAPKMSRKKRTFVKNKEMMLSQF